MKIGKDYIGLACGAMIMNQNEEILLLQRSENSRNDFNKWGIPGGKVEYKEIVEEAVVRETEEECNLHLLDIDYIGYVNHFVEDTGEHWVSHVFLAKEWENEAVNLEPEKHQDMQWFHIDSIPEESSAIVFRAVELYKEWKEKCST